MFLERYGVVFPFLCVLKNHKAHMGSPTITLRFDFSSSTQVRVYRRDVRHCAIVFVGPSLVKSCLSSPTSCKIWLDVNACRQDWSKREPLNGYWKIHSLRSLTVHSCQSQTASDQGLSRVVRELWKLLRMSIH